jgi:hypothetical protein
LVSGKGASSGKARSNVPGQSLAGKDCDFSKKDGAKAFWGCCHRRKPPAAKPTPPAIVMTQKLMSSGEKEPLFTESVWVGKEVILGWGDEDGLALAKGEGAATWVCTVLFVDEFAPTTLAGLGIEGEAEGEVESEGEGVAACTFGNWASE